MRPRKYHNPVTRDPNTGCLIWSGGVDGYGHPISTERGRTFRIQHRVFLNTHGFKPTRITMLCRNKLCVNVEHMQDSQASKEEKQAVAIKANKEERIKYLRLALANLESEQGPDVVAARELYEKELKELEK